MDTLSYKTVSATPSTIDKQWVVVDATDQIVGRLAAQVAVLLRGKHKVNYTPHMDCGDNVIIINAEKVRFTGKKLTDKVYLHHTGYPGGQRFANPKEMLSRKPEFVIEEAVRKMLPKTRLGSALYSNLYVYAGSEHPHQAQNPKVINLIEK
ncbi:MAG: 50S ribosomal protein L13 [Bacteroidales bacterium]|nr:50S ribosomal protein L13 [Bacteroidales bacterium]